MIHELEMSNRSSSFTTATVDIKRYPWPFFAEDEIQAATLVLASGKVNYWTGQEGREFEREFANAFDVPYAVAMANGTVTLQACLQVLGIGQGDEVITTPRTFVGTSSAIVLEGAHPVFADIDRDSGNITLDSIERVLTAKTKAILPVHLGGWPCDAAEMRAFADAKGLYLIEDCAQSHGAKIGGVHCGHFGHVSSWSFCQDKIMTTAGEGGMVGTADEELRDRLWSVKDHGKSYDAVHRRVHPPGFRWLHESWGTNWRMTEVQSAIGRIQLRKLGDWSTRRRENADILGSRLAALDVVRVPTVPSHLTHAYYKFYVYLERHALKPDWTRDRIQEEMLNLGLPSFSGSCSEIYLEEAFVRSGLGPLERLPVARELGETSLMFMVHPTIPSTAVHDMADIAFHVLTQATR